MIDFSGYTRKAIQEDMLGQVPDDLDKRQGSMIQTAIGPVAWYLEGTYMILDQIQTNSNPQTAVGEALDLITILLIIINYHHLILMKIMKSYLPKKCLNSVILKK